MSYEPQNILNYAQNFTIHKTKEKKIITQNLPILSKMISCCYFEEKTLNRYQGDMWVQY